MDDDERQAYFARRQKEAAERKRAWELAGKPPVPPSPITRTIVKFEPSRQAMGVLEKPSVKN